MDLFDGRDSTWVLRHTETANIKLLYQKKIQRAMLCIVYAHSAYDYDRLM